MEKSQQGGCGKKASLPGRNALSSFRKSPRNFTHKQAHLADRLRLILAPPLRARINAGGKKTDQMGVGDGMGSSPGFKEI